MTSWPRPVENFILRRSEERGLFGRTSEIMAKATQSKEESANDSTTEHQQPEMDSKYRMIIVAAQRSKQLQRGARPRVDMDTQRHKPTRVALTEVQQGKVDFHFTDKD